MTTADAQHDRSGRITRGWRAFRRWRRARPFWGGLFLALAGLEIFGTTQMSLAGLTFQMGPTGFLSWLIPTILVACGMLTWFTPQQRMFYAIVGSVTAVFSLIAVNLGGFFIGLLLGMVGGALGFAWAPSAPAQPDAAADGPDDDGEDPPVGVEELLDGDPGRTTGGEPSHTPASAEAYAGSAPADLLTDTLPQPRNPLREPAPHDPDGYDAGQHYSDRHHSEHWPSGDQSAGTEPSERRNPPLYAALLLALSLSAAGILVVHNALPAHAAPPCPIAARPTPAATAPAADPAASPAAKQPNGNIVTDIVDGIRGLFGGGNDNAAPAATPTAPATPPIRAASPTASPSTGGKPSTTPGTCTKPTAPGPGGRKPGAKPATPKPGKPAPLIATAADQPTVAKTPSRLTGSKVTMKGLRLAGIVELPTADGGTLRALKFSMRNAVTDDFALQIPGKPKQAMLFKSKALTVDGNVSFYATRFSGRLPLLGIEVTLTPDLPIPPDGIPVTAPLDVVFDDPDIQLAFVDCNTLTGKPSLHLTLN